jgi:hypothetical protein
MAMIYHGHFSFLKWSGVIMAIFHFAMGWGYRYHFSFRNGRDLPWPIFFIAMGWSYHGHFSFHNGLELPEQFTPANFPKLKPEIAKLQRTLHHNTECIPFCR